MSWFHFLFNLHLSKLPWNCTKKTRSLPFISNCYRIKPTASILCGWLDAETTLLCKYFCETINLVIQVTEHVLCHWIVCKNIPILWHRRPKFLYRFYQVFFKIKSLLHKVGFIDWMYTKLDKLIFFFILNNFCKTWQL